MAIIPQEVFDLYNEFCDDFINDNFGVNCIIYYPPTQIACTTCTTDVIGNKPANHFQSGGPAPFRRRDCAFCGGSGFKESIQNETIKLRVYDEPKTWIKVANYVNIPDGSVQVIGFLTDAPKLYGADYIILNSDQTPYGDFKYRLNGAILPHGFKKNRYFIAILSKS